MQSDTLSGLAIENPVISTYPIVNAPEVNISAPTLTPQFLPMK